jgi:hypothetical protein
MKRSHDWFTSLVRTTEAEADMLFGLLRIPVLRLAPMVQKDLNFVLVALCLKE